MARLFFAKIAGNTIVINNSLKNTINKYHPLHLIMHDTWIFKVALCTGAHVIIDPNPHLDYRQHNENTVGMELTYIDKFRQFVDTITERQMMPQLEELYAVYSNEMEPEYREMIERLARGKNSINERLKIAMNKEIDYNNFFMNIAFRIKIVTNSY